MKKGMERAQRCERRYCGLLCGERERVGDGGKILSRQGGRHRSVCWKDVKEEEGEGPTCVV